MQTRVEYPPSNTSLRCLHSQKIEAPPSSLLIFPCCSLSLPLSCSLFCHHAPLSKCASFSSLEHAQDGPSCEKMSDVYHPPPSFPNMHTHANTYQTQEQWRTCTRAHTHTHTWRALFTHNTTVEISLVRGSVALIFSFSLVLVRSSSAPSGSCESTPSNTMG